MILRPWRLNSKFSSEFYHLGTQNSIDAFPSTIRQGEVGASSFCPLPLPLNVGLRPQIAPAPDVAAPRNGSMKCKCPPPVIVYRGACIWLKCGPDWRWTSLGPLQKMGVLKLLRRRPGTKNMDEICLFHRKSFRKKKTTAPLLLSVRRHIFLSFSFFFQKRPKFYYFCCFFLELTELLLLKV